MFSYSPTTQDNSGQILAAGQVGAAQANAQMMGQMGENIGGALQAIGGMYGEIESQKAKGRAFKDVFKVVSPSLGMSMEQLESVAGGKLKNDRDWFKASEMLMPMMPALINSQLGQQRIGVQQNAPILNAGLQGAARVAGGEGTVPLPEEPPLPAMDNSTLPPSQPSQPSPDAMSAANAWYNQSNRGMIQSGSMQPFWRRNP
jgi:hypothetical protein